MKPPIYMLVVFCSWLSISYASAQKTQFVLHQDDFSVYALKQFRELKEALRQPVLDGLVKAYRDEELKLEYKPADIRRRGYFCETINMRPYPNNPNTSADSTICTSIDEIPTGNIYVHSIAEGPGSNASFSVRLTYDSSAADQTFFYVSLSEASAWLSAKEVDLIKDFYNYTVNSKCQCKNTAVFKTETLLDYGAYKFKKALSILKYEENPGMHKTVYYDNDSLTSAFSLTHKNNNKYGLIKLGQSVYIPEKNINGICLVKDKKAPGKYYALGIVTHAYISAEKRMAESPMYFIKYEDAEKLLNGNGSGVVSSLRYIRMMDGGE